jgi:hypothetical protein
MEDESVVYRQLAGSGLRAGDTGNSKFSQNIDGIKDGLVLTQSNDSNFADLKTVNDASFRSGSDIIPGSMTFAVKTFVDNGQETLITPKVGEIWRVIMPIAKVTAGSVSTTIGYEYFLKDTSTAVQYRVFFSGSTSSSPILNEDVSFDGMPYLELGHGMELIAEISSFSATSISFGVYAGRVK